MTEFDIRVEGDKELIAKLRRVRRDMKPASIAAKRGFERIALILVDQMKDNIKEAEPELIDKGHLLSSIAYRYIKDKGMYGIEVGTIGHEGGIYYARLMEFGGVYSQKMFNNMFARMREDGSIGKSSGKNNIRKPGDKLKPRPYVYPAMERHRERITQIMAEEVLKGLKDGIGI